MRLDKYLKVSRLIKRRTVAKEIAELNRVYINNKLAKPASEVKENDIIKIMYGNKVLEIKVLDTINQIKKQDVQTMYEVLSETIVKKPE